MKSFAAVAACLLALSVSPLSAQAPLINVAIG